MKVHPFDGLTVVLVYDVPKMQLSPRVVEVLKPEFVAGMNAWMKEFFGMTNSMPDGLYKVVGRYVYMNPRTLEDLREYNRTHNMDWGNEQP